MDTRPKHCQAASVIAGAPVGDPTEAKRIIARALAEELAAGTARATLATRWGVSVHTVRAWERQFVRRRTRIEAYEVR